MVPITIVTGAYKPTYNWGASHCMQQRQGKKRRCWQARRMFFLIWSYLACALSTEPELLQHFDGRTERIVFNVMKGWSRWWGEADEVNVLQCIRGRSGGVCDHIKKYYIYILYIYRQQCNWFRWPHHNEIHERRISQMVPRAKWSIVPTSVKFSQHWLAVSGCITSGWWFGTWLLFSHHIGNLIIPTDELHHFSEG